jgi:hypothetical protein
VAGAGDLDELRAVQLVPIANLSGWQLIENQAILLWDEGSLQTYWLDGCRSAPVLRVKDVGVDVQRLDGRSFSFSMAFIDPHRVRLQT